MLIDQGHRRISRHLDLTRVRILGTVAARGPIRPSAIAAELGLTASATGRHLTALGTAVSAEVISDWSDEDVATALALITRLNQAWAQRADTAARTPRSEAGSRWLRGRRPAETREGESWIVAVALLWAPRSARGSFG